MSDSKKQTNEFVIVMFSCLFLLVTFSWLHFNEVFALSRTSPMLAPLDNIFIYVNTSFVSIFIIYSIFAFITAWFIPTYALSQLIEKKNKYYYLALAIILTIIIPLFYPYYPLFTKFLPLFLLVHFMATAISATIWKKSLKGDALIFGVTHKPENVNSMTYQIKSIKDIKEQTYEDKFKPLVIHQLNRGFFIQGGAGSGKSASIIYPLIFERISQGLPLVIYDYEGDPKELGNNPEDKPPILTRYAYSAILKYRSLPNGKPNPLEFAFINFTDMSCTHRVNPVSKKYINDTQQLKEVINVFSMSLNKEWIKKKDFWADNGIAIIETIQLFLYIKYPQFNTIPHLVALLLDDYDAVFRMLSDYKDENGLVIDPELEQITRNMKPVMVAFDQKAQGQIAGAVSSAQFPPCKLNNKYIFWVLNPDPDDELDLRVASIKQPDINNPDKPWNPKVLCIGNSPSRKNSLDPILTVLLSVVMRVLNQFGNYPNSLIIDEFPTLSLNPDELAHFPNTARKKDCNLTIACQTENQVIEKYGKEKSSIIIGACGTQLSGMLNDYESADRVAKQVGQAHYKRVNISHNDGEGTANYSESLVHESILQAKDVLGLPIGSFIGKVADGEPAWVYGKFKYFEPIHYQLINEIPKYSLPSDYIGGTMAEQNKINNDILESRITANWDKIHNDIANMLAPYRIEEETPKKSKNLAHT